MSITTGDRVVLQELARQVAAIAALPVQQETIRLWKALNALRPVRPMVMIDQIPWHEMDVGDELTLTCEDRFCRTIESQLRRTLYRWKHMPADMVVLPEIVIEKVIPSTGYGYGTKEQTAVLDPQNDVVGHYYLDQIATDADVDRIQTPRVWLEEKATAQREETAHLIFDGILAVRMQGLLPWCAPWDIIVQWHGVEATLYDLTDRPEFMHRLVDRLTDAYLGMLDAAEAQGLLGWGQDTIHCTGAWTDELPAPDFDPARPRTRDLWTFGMAQIFGAVSRTMFDEFEVPSMQRIYRRFGLGYYGCCDPLDARIDLVRKIPNVRKISMSPWADQENGARHMGSDYVFSRKPPPSLLAVDRWDPERVEAELRATLDTCGRYGCPVELILKDVSTVRYQPERLWEWSRIAARLVQA